MSGAKADVIGVASGVVGARLGAAAEMQLSDGCTGEVKGFAPSPTCFW